MLHMKKPSRDDRKQLVARAPKRDGITRESKYEKEDRRKKEEMITASRKRKQEAVSGQKENQETDIGVKKFKSEKKQKKSKSISDNNE